MSQTLLALALLPPFAWPLSTQHTRLQKLRTEVLLASRRPRVEDADEGGVIQKADDTDIDIVAGYPLEVHQNILHLVFLGFVPNCTFSLTLLALFRRVSLESRQENCNGRCPNQSRSFTCSMVSYGLLFAAIWRLITARAMMLSTQRLRKGRQDRSGE